MNTAEVNEFFAAIAAGSLDDVRALLDQDPSLLREVGVDGASPALTALYFGHAPLADELAARTGELSVFEAAAFDETARLSELIDADRDVAEQWSADGWQPLHLAAYFGRTESARILLDNEVPVAEVSHNALTVQPLHAAAAGQHAEIVWLLIASDAPVDARQRHGWTPLHSAVSNADTESIKALIAAGADPSAANDEGTTAFDMTPDPAIRRLLENSPAAGG